jgi:hypothetical protein
VRQQVVAGPVPEAVVDRLEPVQVDEEHTGRRVVAGPVGHQLQEQHPGGQPGQRVVPGLTQRLQQGQPLGSLLLALLPQPPFGGEQGDVLQGQADTLGHRLKQLPLLRVQRGVGAADQQHGIRLAGDPGGGGVQVTEPRHHQGRAGGEGAARVETPGHGHRAGPQHGADLGLQHLGGPLDGHGDRRRLVLRRADRGEELGQLVGRPVVHAPPPQASARVTMVKWCMPRAPRVRATSPVV